jgi:putative transposase
MAEKIHQIHTVNYGVYGVRKVHAELHQNGQRVARCTVERLMKREGLRGIRRAQGPRTTIPGPLADRPADLVDRRFAATAPDCLWVADITYIWTFSGWVYAAFVIDVFARRVVGWQLSTSLHTDLALDALEMGIWTRRRAGRDLSQLTHHSDRDKQLECSQYRAIRYTDRLADAEAVASVGSKGDSYDCPCRGVQLALQSRADPQQRTLAGHQRPERSRRPNTSTGSTTAGSTARSATDHPSRLKTNS